MKYKAMIFDLDGTLVDTLADLASAIDEALEEFGLPTHPADAYRFMIGNGADRFAKRALPADKQHLKANVLEAMRRNYAARSSVESRVYEGMAETINALGKRGVRLAVVTNKDHSLARGIVEHFFGEGVFEHIVGATEGRVKPDPAGTLSVVEEFGVSVDECLFIGDSDVDMQTAQNAGIRSVGVAWGFRGRDELEAAKADIIIESPGEILDLSA